MLDPSRAVKRSDVLVGISHAHSDHIALHTSPTLFTPETSAFFSCPSTRQHKLRYGDHMDVGDVRITLHNANHILGSSQFLIENETSVVYTGDLRLNESMLFKGCDVPHCDTLIIESTYGHPQFHFPEFREVSDDITKWAKQRLRHSNVLFGAYALGKSQELIGLLNGVGITPVVHPRIAEFSTLYNENGAKLGFVSSGAAEAADAMRDPFAAIVPPRLITPAFVGAIKNQTQRRCATALATGWGLLHSFRSQGIDRVFPLSDHCDFYQLIDYVAQSAPKRVYTVHGYEHELAHEITKRLGIPARPLASSQLSLGDF